MSDETDVTSEAARVLGEHADATQGERGDATRFVSRWYCTCGVSIGQDWKPRGELLRAHQAAMLAEAGLLRDYAVNVHESCNRELGTALAMAEGAQIATQEPAGQPAGGSAGRGVVGGGSGAPEHVWHRPDDLCATVPCPQYAPGQSLDLSAFDPKEGA